MKRRFRNFSRSGNYAARTQFARRSGGQAQTQVSAQPAPLPIPTGGWNTIAALTNAPADSAIVLDNWFPEAAYIALRRGHMEHCDTTESGSVDSLMTYNGKTAVDDALFAAVGGTIYDVTTDTPSADVTGLSNDRWQFVQFGNVGGNFLICVNGEDTPRSFDGTNWATLTITASGLSSADLVTVESHLNRLWFVESGTTNAYFLPTAAIQGAAQIFPLAGSFVNGGSLIAIKSWRIEGTGGSNDLLVFLSSKGEAAVFAGTDPTNAATWSLVGTYMIGSPIGGPRCMFQSGGDIVIICLDGVLPLSQALVLERSAAPRVALTANIQPTMSLSARRYADNFGWQIMSYPRGTRVLVNVPAVEHNTAFQYVMNTITGAWCRFVAQNANCWAVWKDRIFFGGQNGLVFEADVGGNDNGASIEADLQTAFHDLGNRGVVKHFGLVRPYLTSSTAITPAIGLNVDYRTGASVDAQETPIDPVALWDSAVWDEEEWPIEQSLISNWQSTATQIGSTVSIRLKVDVLLEGSSEPTLQLNAIDIIDQPGGFI